MRSLCTGTMYTVYCISFCKINQVRKLCMRASVLGVDQYIYIYARDKTSVSNWQALASSTRPGQLTYTLQINQHYKIFNNNVGLNTITFILYSPQILRFQCFNVYDIHTCSVINFPNTRDHLIEVTALDECLPSHLRCWLVGQTNLDLPGWRWRTRSA